MMFIFRARTIVPPEFAIDMSHCRRILIVDDNEDDRFFLTRALTRHGVVAVDWVSDGEEAVEYVLRIKQGNRPELIFVDFAMDRMSGLQLLRWLRQNPVFNDIPVVVLTASRNEEEKATAIALRAKAVYLKPSKRDDLDVIVQKALEHCQAEDSVLV